MSLGLIKMVTLLATNTPVYINPKAAEGMLFMLGVISTMFWTITFTMNKTICSLFGLLSITVFLLSFGVQNETFDTNGGYFGIATSINAFWLAYAELVNDIVGKGKHIIPLGRWNWKKNEASVHPTVPPSEFSPDDVEIARNDVIAV
jgi:succinate-acetate transporter protein